MTASVFVNGTEIKVSGLSAKSIAALLGRFPELRTLLSGGELEIDRLFEMGGDVVGALIAAGCGYPGNRDAEAVATHLPLDAQADLGAAILRLTMPQGFGPFVEKMSRLGLTLNLQTQPQEPSSTESAQPSVNAPHYLNGAAGAHH